jgi:hypothetical protein
MTKTLTIFIFVFLAHVAAGQNASQWKVTLINSTTFKLKTDKNKIPAELITVLFDSISCVANPKEKVNGCTGGQPHAKLKWFAVDKEENYIIFVTYYGYRNRNLCFLANKNSKDKPLVVEDIRGDLTFNEFKTVYLNKDIKVDVWPDN